jgi:hypothetical protein
MTLKVPLNLYNQMIDDHIIFTNVVSNKNTDFQFCFFGGKILYVANNLTLWPYTNCYHINFQVNQNSCFKDREKW